MTRGVPTALLVTAPVTSSFLLLVPLHAYGGPGSIVSGVGALIAALAAVLAAIFGFVWFPLKRRYQHLRGPNRAEEGDEEASDRARMPG